MDDINIHKWLWPLVIFFIVLCVTIIFVVLNYSTIKVILELIISLVSPFLMAASFLIAYKAYRLSISREFRTQQLNQLTAIGEIRKMLNTEENRYIHKQIGLYATPTNTSKGNPKSKSQSFNKFFKQHQYEIYNYLGTLELLQMYLQEGLISQECFNSSFKYRVENVRDCKPLYDIIQKEEKEYWDVLQKLINSIQKS